MTTRIQDSNDTIVALATPAGAGALGIVRLSGPKALSITADLLKKPLISSQTKRSIAVGMIYDGDNALDQVVASVFVGPGSYTGQDLAEISCHGSEYILQRLIRLCLDAGARMAEAGEFTRRAFLNGKLDLAQAEAVADLIGSETQESHKAAMRQMRGGFSQQLSGLRDKLIRFASLLELELDFGEEDVEFANRESLAALILESKSVIEPLIASFTYGNVLKNGVPIAIIGPPNAGKSTLLNSLVNENRAIVSERPGTTRDTIEEQIQINGLRFRFIDTAGLRATEDEIEQEGILRSLEKAVQAQIVLYLVDCLGINPQQAAAGLDLPAGVEQSKILVVLNKQDGLSEAEREEWHRLFPEWKSISAKDKTGLDQLKNELWQRARQYDKSGGQTIITNLRHVESLEKTLEALNQTQAGLANFMPTELLAFHAREALYYLGQITGDISSDDLLDSIFFNFCIGK